MQKNCAITKALKNINGFENFTQIRVSTIKFNQLIHCKNLQIKQLTKNLTENLNKV